MKRDGKGRFVAERSEGKHASYDLPPLPCTDDLLPDGELACPRCFPERYVQVAKHRAEVTA